MQRHRHLPGDRERQSGGHRHVQPADGHAAGPRRHLTVPSTISRTSGFPLSFSVVNTGNAEAKPVVVHVVLSRDNRWSSDDVLLYKRVYTSITPGATMPDVLTESIPSATTPGSYYVMVFVDAPGYVQEGSDTNNAAMRAITVR
jgi:hypothetical protein